MPWTQAVKSMNLRPDFFGRPDARDGSGFVDRITPQKATELNTFLQKKHWDIKNRNPKHKCIFSKTDGQVFSLQWFNQAVKCVLEDPHEIILFFGLQEVYKTTHLWNLLTWSFRLTGSEATHRTRVLATVIGGLLIVSWMATSDSFCRCGNQRLLIDLRRLV